MSESLTALVTFIVTFIVCLQLSISADERAEKRGVWCVSKACYTLVPISKEVR